MTIKEASKHVGCHTATLYRAIQSGDLACSRNEGKHPANKIFIDQADLEEWANNPAPEGLYTKEELAVLKGVSVRTVNSWITKHWLKERGTIGKRKYYHPEDLHDRNSTQR